MRISDVEAFDAVMRTGGTTRAADLLGISQPAVSRSLARLASAVRFPLFRTVKGRLVPTPEAELFHAEVRAAFVGLDRLRATAAAVREFGSGTLRVAAYPALGLSFVPKAVRQFREEWPEVRLTFHVAGSTAIRDLVASGHMDVGLAADEIETTGVAARTFMTPAAVCVMPPGHRLGSEAVITPAHLAGEPLVALSPDDTVQRRLNRLFAEAGVEPRIVVETQYSETLCNLVLEGVGLGLANAASVRASGFAGRGLLVRPFRPEAHFRALLLTPPDRVPSALADAFVKALYAVRNELGASAGGAGPE